MKRLAILTTVLSALAAQPGHAACSFGDNSLPGSIGPGQSDGSRFFTVNGRAQLTISDVHDVAGNASTLEVGFPGYCHVRTGQTVTCDVTAKGRVSLTIANHHSGQIFYYFSCTGL